MASQIEALIDKIAAEYGVPGWVARAVAYGENSSFNPSLIAPDPTPSMPNAVSVGLFQIHDVNTPDRAQRQNAEWNIRWAMQNSVGPAYKEAVAKGINDPSELLTYIWTNGQRAAASAIPGGVQRAMGYLGGEAMPTTQGGNMATPTQSADVTATQPTPTGNATGGFIQWLVDNGWGPSFVDEDPSTGELTLWKNPPQYLYDQWKSETGQTTSGLAPEEAEYKRIQTKQLEQELADYPRLVSLDEREQKRKEIETEIAGGTLEWNKGVGKFNAWLNATGEARLRAEKEMGQKEWQLPTKYFPGTEPGGMLATVAARYGLPWTPLEGTPVTPENSAEGIYNKWQKNMGAPLQAPAFPSNGGSASPIDAMGGAATQLAGMAGGGFLPVGQSAITSEYGPEVITATPGGTQVQPPAKPQFSFATARQAGEPGSLDPNWTGRDLNIPGGPREITMYPWEAPQVVGLTQRPSQPSSAAHQHVNEILRRARWRGYQPYTPRKTEV